MEVDRSTLWFSLRFLFSLLETFFFLCCAVRVVHYIICVPIEVCYYHFDAIACTLAIFLKPSDGTAVVILGCINTFDLF